MIVSLANTRTHLSLNVNIKRKENLNKRKPLDPRKRQKQQQNKTRRHIKTRSFPPLESLSPRESRRESGGGKLIFFENRNVRVRLKEKEQKMNKKHTYK